MKKILSYTLQSKSNLFTVCFILAFLLICLISWSEGGNKAAILPASALLIYLFKAATKRKGQ